MTDPVTTNKGLDLPPNGSYPNAWDVPVNQNFSDIDTALAGYATINATGASGTVALTRVQYLPLQIFIIGTLTADVTYQFPAGIGGQWVVINQTTGAHTITFSSATPGLTVVIPQGLATVISTASGSGDVRFSIDALMKDGSTTATGVIPFADGITLSGGSTLANYVEGTWTPALSLATAGTSSFAYTAQSGWYRRIGKMVRATFNLAFTPTIGTGSGNLQVSGLPVSAGASSYVAEAGSISQLSSTFNLTTRYIVSPGFGASGSLFLFFIYGPAAGTGTIQATNLTDGSGHNIRGGLTYFVD